jgi:predicted ferric reductase
MVSKAIVISVKELNNLTREYIIKLDLPFHHEPGQFLQLTLENVDSSMIWPDSRSFSIASYDLPNNQLRLIIKKEGYYTSRIFDEIKIYSQISVKLPYGNFLPPFDLSNTLCLAGGTGVAPFLSFFNYFKINKSLKNFHLYHSVKFINEAVDYLELSNALSDGFSLFVTREKVNNSFNRRISIEDITTKFSKNTNIYICGNKDFNNYFKNNLKTLGYYNIIVEDW